MADFIDKTVHIVDVKNGEVLGSCKDVAALKKRLPLLREPYPEGTRYLRVKHMGPHFLDTEERKGFEAVAQILISATVTGTDYGVAIDRAIQKGIVEEVEF